MNYYDIGVEKSSEKLMERDQFHKLYEGTTIRNYYEYLAGRQKDKPFICGWCGADNGVNGSKLGLTHHECWSCGGS